MFDKMKQLYDLQKKAKEIQKKLENIIVEKTANGIKIKINGIFAVQSVEIDPTILNIENKTNLESSLCKIFSEAVQDVQKKSASESQALLKGLGI